MRLSPTPRIVTELVNSVPELNAEMAISSRYGRPPPRDYVERDLTAKLAHELRSRVIFRDTTDERSLFDGYSRVRATLQAPLSREELISLLSRAYQAGRDGR